MTKATKKLLTMAVLITILLTTALLAVHGNTTYQADAAIFEQAGLLAESAASTEIINITNAV